MVLVFDLATNATSTIAVPGALQWSGGVLTNSGRLYLTPFYASAVVIFNPDTQDMVLRAMTAGVPVGLGK